MSVCPQCQSDDHLRLQRRDGEPGYTCTECGTWLQFGALPPKEPSRARVRAHKASPGRWPEDLPVDDAGKVEEGLVVWSKSGALEGRTTGVRQRCTSVGCPGWFVAVTWETGQALRPCTQGMEYDTATRSLRVTGGGEISARFVSPAPMGIDPLPKEEWPAREALAKRKGWRKTP
jgi:Zn ribbon nucleic-acid-binding protein